MSMRAARTRLLALLLGWALVLSVLTGAPTSATVATAPGEPAATTSEESSGETGLDGAATSLLEGLEVPVADIDPDAATTVRPGATEEHTFEDELQEAAARTDLSAVLERPATREHRPRIDPSVGEALADAEDGRVTVVIEMTGSADLAELAARADSAGLAAADGVRRQSSTYDAETARAAASAADDARAHVVVETLQATGADQRAALIADLGGGDPETTEPETTDLWVVNSVGARIDADQLAELEAREDVAHVRLEEQVLLPEIASEPALPTWSLEKVHAPQTWGEYGYRGEGVTVAVLDTGVDYQHPALAGQYRGRDGDHSDSWFVTTGENYPVPGDGNGHGTHVTGSIAGGPPGEVIGVAPDAEWIGVKILSDGGRGGEVGILNGMQWVLAPGGDPAKAPDIASNSWGSGPGNNDTFWDAVAAWRAAGIVPLFANGNDGPASATVGNPGGYPHSIGVGATDSNDQIASFSSRGPATWGGVDYVKPQVSAPGAAIYSAWPQHSGQDYHTISGTSMATPHVSGVAALVLSAAPGLGVDELQDVLEDTARAEQFMGELPNNAYGHGIVDSYAATTRAAHSGLIAGRVTGPDGPVAATVGVVDGSSTTADPTSGDYELYAVAGTQTVRVTAYGYASQEHEVEVTEGGLVELDITLVAVAEATLSGTVTTGGSPVSGAAIQVVGQPGATAYSDESGSYAIQVPHGTHEIRVQATGYRPWTGEITVGGDVVHDVVLEQLALPGTNSWPELKANAPGHGLAASGLDAPSLERQWSTTLGASLFNSPVATDDSVYVMDNAGRLNALDLETGTSRWQVQTGTAQRGTPAVSADGGTVFVTTGTAGTLLALDTADGSSRWSYSLEGEVPTYGTPTVVDGTVYVAVGSGDDGSVHAVDAVTGERVWRTPIGGGVFFGPSVADGVAVAASVGGGTITALDTTSGEVLWERSDTISITLPAIDAGKVYLGTSDSGFTTGTLLALDLQTGEPLWEAEGHGDTQGSSPVLYDDLVILGSHTAGTVAAYDATTGELVWNHFVGSAVTSSVAVTTSGVVLGASQNWGVYALDASTGERLWEDQMPAPVLASTAVSDDAALFLSRDGTLAAYRSAGAVGGTVTGPEGPVGAAVELVGTDHETTTDPDTGTYELRAPAGDYTLRISSYGLSTHTEEITLRPSADLTVDATLTPVGSGSLQGTVVDEAGDPLEGATLTLTAVPLDPETTGADGSFGFGTVAEGEWELVAELPGYATQTQTVAVTAGESTTVEVVLGGFDLAVVADYNSRLSAILRDHGWSVDELSFAEAALAPGSYDAIVLNGRSGDYARDNLEAIETILTEGDAAGTSIIALDNWGAVGGSVDEVLQLRGSEGHLESVYGNRGPVWLTEPVEHPITAPIDQPRFQILSDDSHAWLVGYEGGNLATLGNDSDGARGSGIGYERTSTDSVQVLLPSHAASVLVGPGVHWTDGAEEIFIASVEHAVSAEFGTVAATVTGPDGGPVDAELTVVGSFEHEDLPGGTGEMILPAGTHTLRVSAAGMASSEHEVSVATGEVTPLEVALEASDGGAIAGTVRDASGSPIAGAEVMVEGGEPVTTGAGGSYQIPDLEVGSYTVTASADGYLAETVADVAVTAGTVTTVDFALVSAPNVAVVGDYSNRLTDFLNDAQIPATAVGWEVMDDLASYDVVILQHPAVIPDQQWLENLTAFDEAGVSVIFPASNTATSTRGIYELSELTGNPAGIERHGGFNSDPKELTDLVEHPITAGLGEEPVIYLNADSDAPYFVDYQGTPLAAVGMNGTPAGVGIAYDVRTPDSVHVLLSGLFVSAGTETGVEWAPEGRQLVLNAVRYAGDPGLAQISGSVTDPDGVPVRDAEVTVWGQTWSATTGADGQFLLGLPDGQHTVQVSAFGYATQTQEVTVVDGAPQDLTFVLQLGDVTTLDGTVTGSALPGTGLSAGAPAAEGVPLEGAVVRIVGTPLETLTDNTGHYSFPLVELGEQELEIELDGYIRTLHPLEVTAGGHTEDVLILESARVGVVADSTSGVHQGRLGHFLTDWGYEPVDIDWTDPAATADLDMVLVNNPSFVTRDLPAFLDSVNRADLPVVWTGNRDRGAIEAMVTLYGNPEGWVEGSLDGAVTTTVTADHPLTAGLPETFATTDEGRMYGAFTGYSGTTVATLASEAGGSGDSIAFDGRTAGSVDVLLSTNGASTYGAVGTRDLPEFYFSPETSRSLTNALQWALTADGLGADTRGTVVSSTGQPLEATVTVEETGRTYPAREGDGSYVIPLEPGTWTLSASTFGHDTASSTVTIVEGESVTSQIVLPVSAGGPITGTVLSPEGAPVPGASVSVAGTEYAVTTAANGTFTLPHLPSGDWVVVASAEGMVTDFVDVSVTDGASATAEARLGASRHLALVGDINNGSMGAFLTSHGYTIDTFPYAGLDQVDVTTGAYDLVFLNGNGVAPAAEVFTGFLDEAAAHDVPVVLPSQYNSGSIRHLSSFLGDPASVDNDFEPNAMGLQVGVEHPVFDGYDVGETVTLLSNPGQNQQFQSFAGYTGTVLADTVHPETGTVFDQAVGFRFASPGSVQLLLGSLGSSSYGSPVSRWTFDAERITLNGVSWALEARQSSVSGTVTGHGGPVEGAEVTVAGTTTRDETDADGAYQVGVAAGEVTLEATAEGFEPYSATVTVAPEENLVHDIELTPLAESTLTVTVVDDLTGEPVPDAEVDIEGPTDGSAQTGADGTAVFEQVLVGDYTVTVLGPRHVVATGEVTVGEDPAALTVEVSAIRVGVLGDVRGDLTDFLVGEGVASQEVDWAEAATVVDDYGVVIVNGGDPSGAEFEALLTAADGAHVDLVFTGTYGVSEGGIRLLEEHSDDVEVGGQGYADGAVGLTELADHPIFADVADPAHIVADDGYYSWLSAYSGESLATLTVGGDPVGTAVVFDQRTAASGHLLLSFAAVSDYMGPDRGWTEGTEQVVLDSLEWLLLPSEVTGPVLEWTPEEGTAVLEPEITVTGTVSSDGAEPVTVTVQGESVPVAGDGSFEVLVPLVEGPQAITVVATDSLGQEVSQTREVAFLDLQAHWQLPADGAREREVRLALTAASGLHVRGDGVVLQLLQEDQVVTELDMQWAGRHYTARVSGVPRGTYDLRAVLSADGFEAQIDGPSVDLG